MSRTSAQLRADALAIWHAAVEAVRSDQLVENHVRVDGSQLVIGDEIHDLVSIGKIVVVGAGKAGTGMAAGLEAALGKRVLREKHVRGWVNVPADCIPKLEASESIHLHPARPAGLNEPTAAGVAGSEKILELVSSLGPSDLCLCLISGGGSALLPAPVAGISLAEKQAVTRLLSGGGANIQELNAVRKQLSRIKGGGLARACSAGRLIALIISDVLGDPLDVIASGPTVPDTSTPAEALAILERYARGHENAIPAALSYLRELEASHVQRPGPSCRVTNHIIGNNAVAVRAAGCEASRRGYSPELSSAAGPEGAAEEIGKEQFRRAIRTLSEPGPDCLIAGGEPTVTLAPPERRGKGGRNQQLILAAIVEMMNSETAAENAPLPVVMLSGGTDGEDGPTDAAGAVCDSELLARMRQGNIDPSDYLNRNDAYHFFEPLGGLIKTGPTHTNVCDVRVTLVDRLRDASPHKRAE